MVFGFFACIAEELDFCLCPGWVAPRFLSSDCAALSFSFNGFEEDVSDPRGRVANASFLGLSELGFRWCLAFSHALPMSLIFVFVQAGLRYVFCTATALLSPSLLTVSKRTFRTRVEGLRTVSSFVFSLLTVAKRTFRTRVEGLGTPRFWACLSSDLGGVWLFRMHCRGT